MLQHPNTDKTILRPLSAAMTESRRLDSSQIVEASVPLILVRAYLLHHSMADGQASTQDREKESG